MIGSVRITYDGWTYEGHFDKMDYTFEEEKNRGGLKFSFDFTAMRIIDHQDPVGYVTRLDQPNVPARGNPARQIATGPRGPNGEMLPWDTLEAWEGTNTFSGPDQTFIAETELVGEAHLGGNPYQSQGYGINGITPAESVSFSSVFQDDGDYGEEPFQGYSNPGSQAEQDAADQAALRSAEESSD